MTGRFAQQVMVDGIGEAGQRRLAEGRVLIVGAGGLGVPAATVLGAMGVGRITIMDGDRVDERNLHRQFAYGPDDRGGLKAEILAGRVQEQNPDMVCTGIGKFADERALERAVPDHDVVCDCTDSLESRLLIDRVCGEYNKPVIFASIGGWVGYVTVLHHERRFKLSEAFPLDALYAKAILDCSAQGVVPTVSLVLGGLQANEAVKVLIGSENVLDGKLLCVDLRLSVQRVLKLHRVGA
jgi:adenylyltransferase/sulfurtransferase